MSDEKTKVSDKASEIAKNIWLAGVGAYGKAVEDAQDRLEKALEPPKLFRDLVKAGTALEDDAREVIESTHAARQSVEERINRVRENFNNQRPARTEDLLALHKKVDQLTRKVDQLSKALTASGIAKKPVKNTARSPANKKTKPSAKRKAAPKRAAAAKKKTAKKKVTAKKSATRRQPAAGKRKA